MKVFLSEYIHHDSYQLLKKHVEIISDIKDIYEADGIITRNIKIDASLMQQIPHLKVIGIHGTGVDDVDIDEAIRLGIKVYHVPNQNANSVAELIVAFMLSLSRHLIRANEDSKRQLVQKTAPAYLEGQELQNKTVGLIGVGAVNQQVAKILKYGFNMNILGYSRTLNQQKAKSLAIDQAVDLQTLLKESDYVVLGIPANKETYHLIDDEKLKLMKKNSYLINTARGSVLDEAALYQALKEKWIAGAACDVFDEEPTTSPLLTLSNFIATPHIGANTGEALKRVGDLCVKQMIDGLNGLPLIYQISK